MGHAAHVDNCDTDIDGAACYQENERIPMVLVVCGPDENGDFGILGAGGEWSILPRFVAEDLIYELAKRLAQRK